MTTPHANSSCTAKEAAGRAAAALVKSNMLVGLGTGSTASYFIMHLAKRCREGLNIKAVATSTKSQELALKEKIPLIDINQLTTLDLTVDGADEIDLKNRMIKGGGGALLREKIIASMSRTMIIVVDEHKRVDYLGKFPLPVEIAPFGFKATISQFKELGYDGKLRVNSHDEAFITDNGHYIFDIHFPYVLLEPELDNLRLQNVPGVLTTGFFFNLAHQVIIGYEDGHVEFRS